METGFLVLAGNKLHWYLFGIPNVCDNRHESCVTLEFVDCGRTNDDGEWCRYTTSSRIYTEVMGKNGVYVVINKNISDGRLRLRRLEREKTSDRSNNNNKELLVVCLCVDVSVCVCMCSCSKCKAEEKSAIRLVPWAACTSTSLPRFVFFPISSLHQNLCIHIQATQLNNK